MPLDDAARAAQDHLLARARAKSVFICTPIARHPVRQYTVALARTLVHLSALGIRGYVQTVVGNSNLPRARNELVAAFLASDYTDLLFIDDDMGWEPEDVVRLLASDKPMIGGAGSKKRLLPDNHLDKWCFRADPRRDLVQDDLGAIRVDGIGTGFVKIERDVFERLIAAHPDWKRRGWASMPEKARAQYYGFFKFSQDFDEMGEDFDFCRSWCAIGGDVWLDPTIRLVHVGEYEFTGDLTALFSPGEEA